MKNAKIGRQYDYKKSMTKTEAAAALGCSRAHVAVLAKRHNLTVGTHKFPYVRAISDHSIYLRSEIEALAVERKQKKEKTT